jgi:hypothetical protein
MSPCQSHPLPVSRAGINNSIVGPQPTLAVNGPSQETASLQQRGTSQLVAFVVLMTLLTSVIFKLASDCHEDFCFHPLDFLRHHLNLKFAI